MTGKYVKKSLDSSGRIIFDQENGDYVLYVNDNNHWIVSSKNLNIDRYIMVWLFIMATG